MTVGSGYVYQISLASPGISSTSSFMTDDGTGTGGTAVDAPPGSTLLVARVLFSNNTGRPEPLVGAGLEALPSSAWDNGLELGLAVPVADAAAFGIQSPSTNDNCTTTTNPLTDGLFPPDGFCSLPQEIGAFSPAQTDITQPPQISPGGAGSLTYLAAQDLSGTWIPQSAPVHDVKLFVQPNSTCKCWSTLGS
jgi:hypothetical protein